MKMARVFTELKGASSSSGYAVDETDPVERTENDLRRDLEFGADPDTDVVAREVELVLFGNVPLVDDSVEHLPEGLALAHQEREEHAGVDAEPGRRADREVDERVDVEFASA